MDWLSDVSVPMRDGTRLSAEIYLPDGDDPGPAILLRTPYDNSAEPYLRMAERFVGAGYAVVVQDCRGRGDSDGDFRHFDEVEDGLDTIDWVAGRPWCDGQVAMTGLSYESWAQLSVAGSGGPHLRCLVPAMMTAALDTELIYRDGALQLQLLLTWLATVRGRTMRSLGHLDLDRAYATLPLAEADLAVGGELPRWREWLGRPADDERWSTLRVEDLDRIEVPLLQVSGWFDFHAMPVLDTFEAVRRDGAGSADQSRVIIGPWKHDYEFWARTEVGEMDCGADAAIDLPRVELDWFDRWLKGVEADSPEAPLRLFVMGENRWRDEHEWPLARTEWRHLYLHSSGAAAADLDDGTLTAGAPDAEETPDAFAYDPTDPVPTVGGPCDPFMGPVDRREVARRDDVVTYSTEPLTEELEVTGPVAAVLYVEAGAPTSAWSVHLVDVAPDGRAWGLCEALVDTARATGVETVSRGEGPTLQRVELRVGVTSYVFPPGHRIRVEVSSSNFPRFARTPDPARNRIHHGAATPSHIVLPTIPRDREESV